MPAIPLGNPLSCSVEHMWELPKYYILGYGTDCGILISLMLVGTYSLNDRTIELVGLEGTLLKGDFSPF